MQKHTAMLSAALIAAGGIHQSTAQAQDTVGLETILVTAQKRSEDIQKVPLSVIAFEEKALEQLSIDTPSDLANLVPGFSLQSIAGQSLPFIRGLGLQSSGPWQEALTSTYIDGVYYINPSIGASPLNNVARVEVDKGPQGTLFGRNAVGGVVAYITKDPQQEPHGDFKVGYGNYNTWESSLYYTTGITDNLAADISITGYDQGKGWGKNLYSGEQSLLGYEYAARSKWVLKASDRTKVTFIADYERVVSPTAYGAMRDVYSFITQGTHHVGGYYDSYAPTRAIRDLFQYGASAKIEHEFDWATAVSISAWRYDRAIKNNAHGFDVPYLPATPAVGQVANLRIDGSGRVFDNTGTQEFQLLSPSSSTIKWVAGAFFLYNDSGLNYSHSRQTSLPTGSRDSIAHTGQKTESYSGFAQATAPIFEGTRITGGIRFTSDHRAVRGYAEQNTVANNAVYTLVPGSRAEDNPRPEGTWSKPTYKAALEHDFTDSILGYASFSTGFESAYYSMSSSASVAPLEPVTVDAYEVGVKSQLFDNRLRVNAAAFLYNLYNVVVTHVVNGNQQTNNAANSIVKGIDVDLAFRPTQELTLTAALEYIDPHFQSFPGAQAFAPNATNSYSSVIVDASGQQLQYSERFSASATASYVVPTRFGELSFVGEVSHHSGMHYDTQNLSTQAPYTLLNASIGLRLPNDQWDVKLWGKNLSNVEYATLFPGTSAMVYIPKPPRTYGLRVGYHW